MHLNLVCKSERKPGASTASALGLRAPQLYLNICAEDHKLRYPYFQSQEVSSSEKQGADLPKAGQSLLVGECRASRKSASARAISSWRPSAGSASARPNVIEWSASAAASAAATFSKRALASGTPRFDIAQSSSSPP